MALITASAAPVEGVTVPLAGVDRELSRQLAQMHGAGEKPVHRVCMSNLVIFTNKPQELDELLLRVSDVVTVHPARVLLLIGGVPGDAVRASVRVQSHRLGNRDQAVSEIIIVQAPVGLVDRLPFAVRALIVGDLPINLWWASNTPPPLAGPMLSEMAEHVQQIMYDSLGWPDPVKGMAATASWIEATERFERGRWRVVSDLNWRRLKYWRRFLTQAFEGAESKGASEVLSDVLIEHGPHAVIQAWELAGWMAHRLDWKTPLGRVQGKVEMAWKFAGKKGDVTVRIRRLDEGPSEVRRVRLGGTVVGRPMALDLSMENEYRLVQRIEGSDLAPLTMTVPGLSPAEVVGRQLSDRERDPVFRASMATAQGMARGLVG